jgi:hypothetical protein
MDVMSSGSGARLSFAFFALAPPPPPAVAAFRLVPGLLLLLHSACSLQEKHKSDKHTHNTNIYKIQGVSHEYQRRNLIDYTFKLWASLKCTVYVSILHETFVVLWNKTWYMKCP